MAKGYFNDDQSTLVLNEVVGTAGEFPSTGGGEDDEIIGLIRTFAFDFAPGGYSAAGQSLQISTNSAAFAIFGTTFGGNATTNFDLPNLSGRVAIGVSASAPEGASTGASTASVSAAEFPASLGGTAQPVSIAQPSLSVEYLIRTEGMYPSSGGGVDGGFLGEVMAFAGNFVPGGWALANGQLLSISNNSALFSVLGTTYGGNGLSNFALPNLTGRNIVGTSPTLALGTVVGQSSVTLTKADLPPADGGSTAAFNDQSPGLALNYIIATQGIFPTQDNDGAALDSQPYLGEVRAFAGLPNSIPAGWVLCEGQLLSIATNTALFALLGTQYGGNGSTNFALPNLENTTVASLGGSNNPGDTYGSNTTTLVVTNNTPCLCRGTSVLTPRGDVPVETLRIGDEVITGSGGARPVRWVGRRRYDGPELRSHSGLHPVRFRAGSLGGGRPLRDLLVSPEHAMFLDGVLVPAKFLVNGATIVIEADLPSVEYFHLELPAHDLVIAEGAACESFVDDDSRQLFDNAAEYAQLYPNAPAPGNTCAPKLEAGSLLQAIRRRLDQGRVQEVSLSRVGIHRIAVRPGVSAVRLLTHGCYASGDTRRLGVAVGRLRIDGETLPLTDPRLSTGWHACEAGWRWTDGAALLLTAAAAHLEVSVSALPRAAAA